MRDQSEGVSFWTCCAAHSKSNIPPSLHEKWLRPSHLTGTPEAPSISPLTRPSITLMPVPPFDSFGARCRARLPRAPTSSSTRALTHHPSPPRSCRHRCRPRGGPLTTALSSSLRLASHHRWQSRILPAQRSLVRSCGDERLHAVRPNALSPCPLMEATQFHLSPSPSHQVKRMP